MYLNPNFEVHRLFNVEISGNIFFPKLPFGLKKPKY